MDNDNYYMTVSFNCCGWLYVLSRKAREIQLRNKSTVNSNVKQKANSLSINFIT